MKRFQIGIPKPESLPKGPSSFSSFSLARTCTTMGSVWTIFLPRNAMPLNRPNLTLDQQSFQGLLSAAFTIQEHNDRRKLARQTQAEPEARPEPEAARGCRHCGAPMSADASRCGSCGREEFRPGERMQRKWASMWLMSQEQGLWPERAPEIAEGTRTGVPPVGPERRPLAQAAHDRTRDTSALVTPALDTPTLVTPALDDRSLDTSALVTPAAEYKGITEATEDLTAEDPTAEVLTPEDAAPEDSDPALQPFELSTSDDSFLTDASARPRSMIQRFSELRVKLRFQRADLYLGTAILVATVALLWPVATPPRRAALGPWERALVTLGIAEAPAATPVVHFQGDPAINVWIDPHTAIYYCPDEEQYGKTAGGHFSSQREAQMDSFEPAGRSPCE